MSEAVVITVPLPAEGKGRPRFTRNGIPYTPAKTRAFEKAVATYAVLVWRHRKMIDGPVRLDITAEYRPPRSWPKKRQAEAISARWKVSKPDGDNIQKALTDAMNEIAFGDDAQVAEWSGRKVWGEHDRITITIEAIE